MKAPKLWTLALLAFLLVSLVLLSGCLGQENASSNNRTIEDVTLEEAFTLIEDNRSNPDFVIIDLRTAAEYASGHIEKAINLDYNSENFEDELDELDKDKTYLIYCQTDQLSGKVLDMMEKLGFREVYNLLGGIAWWKKVKLPTVK